MNGILFTASIFAAIRLLQIKKIYPSNFTPFQKNQSSLLIITLSISFITILGTQLLQQHLTIKPYDAPLRLLICIPIFLYLCHHPLPITKFLEITLPAATVIALITVLFFPPAYNWGDRFATTPADPNAFGAYITCLTALIIYSLDPKKLLLNKKVTLLKLIGIFSGIYLIAGSGTRGAWLSIPVLGLLWFIFNIRRHFKLTSSVIAMALIGCTLAYLTIPHLQARVDSGFYEVYAWLFSSDKDTSAGVRFSMWEITIDLFLERPFTGFSDTGYQALLDRSFYLEKYSPIVLETIDKAGPHNEYLANLLRSGIGGLISVLVILGTPLYILSSNKNNSEIDRELFLAGLAIFIALSITALSIEIFNLKFTSSFYALIITMLCAEKITTTKTIN